eukprot:CAMPEP_0116127280 /NCGR_PEP_ID=MMETSP0329-20121206/6761_1 /TAXON_ID=697910 /ORGANISM="Pseudo-nitzschia arenysensis, Strain B593" /LENGTH=501 /DNA_ID=CAMNT_0003621379 /DNA_START=118 /DNA_END=1623 /DNA_ORIENTATION=+
MKLSSFSLTVFAASAASVAYSFAPTPAFVRVASGSAATGTTLYISSWGKADTDTDTTVKNENPSTNIQSYLEEPDSVDPRPTLEGSILVSGFVNAKERTDQFVFDLLNHEDSAFEYKKIVAFVDDEKFAKKRLLSRSARYTGLLDKLDFKEAAVEGALPVAAQLEDIDSWLATVESSGDLVEKVKAIAALAKDASDLENLSVMVTNAAGESISAADRVSVVEALKDTGKDYTLLVIGKLEDRDEGKTPYKFRNFDSDDDEEALLPEDAVFSREEAMRMVTETLQLDAGANKALTFSEVLDTNTTEAKLIKGLREAGYARCQEIDHMLRDGPENYQKALDDFDEKNPNWGEGIYATEAWWEDPKFIAQVDEAKASYSRTGEIAAEVEEEEEEIKDERTLEVEQIATEWAKREFFSQSMAGTVSEDMDESEFIESVWERAMFEGDLKYRQMNGEEPDVEAELLDYKTQQERKQQTMLKMAKQELQDVLDEENLGGVDDNVDTD